MALLGAACGGADEASGGGAADSTATGIASSAKAPTLNGAPDFAGQAPLAKLVVDRLGGDGPATTAILLAAEFGYSAQQILDGAASGLQPDGTITNQSPAGPPLGRIDVPSNNGSASERGKVMKRPATRHIATAQQAGEGKILIDKLRSLATGALTQYEATTQIGIGGVGFILELLNRGLTPEQVVDSLVLGLFFYEVLGTCYTQSIPLSTPPVERICDGAESAANAAPAEPDEPQAIAPASAPENAAVYQGDLATLDLADSNLVVTILPDGTVTGELTATEELDNYLASVNVVCGLFADDEQEVAEDCADTVVECPATVLWRSDLSGLKFVGEAPDSGVVSGTISINWDTTPHGCGEPSTAIQPLEIEATVSPDGAQITVPFEIDLDRVESPS